MNPSSYFPEHYRADLRVFAGNTVPAHGSFGVLCGMTLGNVFEPGRREQYVGPEDFLCALYYLNVLSQGIYTYFPMDHAAWLANSESFPDVRACNHHHGGVSKPGDILRFARHPEYVTGAQALDLPVQLLCSYRDFFMQTYIPDRCTRGLFTELNARALLERLRQDADCPEWSTWLLNGNEG